MHYSRGKELNSADVDQKWVDDVNVDATFGVTAVVKFHNFSLHAR